MNAGDQVYPGIDEGLWRKVYTSLLAHLLDATKDQSDGYLMSELMKAFEGDERAARTMLTLTQSEARTELLRRQWQQGLSTVLPPQIAEPVEQPTVEPASVEPAVAPVVEPSVEQPAVVGTESLSEEDSMEALFAPNQVAAPPAPAPTEPDPISPTEPAPDLNEIRRAFELLKVQGDVVELRSVKAIDAKGYTVTVAGFYNDPNELVNDSCALSSNAEIKTKNVYWTLQQLKPETLNSLGRPNGYTTRLKDAKLTEDEQVAKYKFLPIDFDPSRPADTSSNEAEKKAALELATTVRDFLATFRIVTALCDSGNGNHLLAAIDLEVNLASTELIKNLLAGLEAKFGTAQVGIDTKVYNPSRIWKVYGTVARKGPNTVNRPWRMARILDSPALTVTSEETLRQLLAALPIVAETSETGFAKKPEDWLNEPFIHRNPGIDNQLVAFAGHYIGTKNIRDPEELYVLLTAKLEKNGCYNEDGVTPFAWDDARVREIAEKKVKAWQTEEDYKPGRELVLNQTPTVVADAAQAVTTLDEWLDDKKKLTSEEASALTGLLSDVAYADRRKKIVKKLDWRTGELDAARKRYKQAVIAAAQAAKFEAAQARRQALATVDIGTLETAGVSTPDAPDATSDVDKHVEPSRLSLADIKSKLISVLQGRGMPWTNRAVADLFDEMFGENYLYATLGKDAEWMTWTGSMWHKGNITSMLKRAGGFLKRVRTEIIPALRVSDGNWVEIFQDLDTHCAGAPFMNGVMQMLQAKRLVDATDFDPEGNPPLLNFINGTYEMDTDVFRPSRREDMSTQTLVVPYTAGATCPMWLKFLENSFPDVDVREFLHRFLGYMLEGTGDKKYALFLHGYGDNGKSILVGILMAIFGYKSDYSYGKVSGWDSFAEVKSGAVRNDIARLRNARAVFCDESDKDMVLKESTFKSLTGMSPITTRFFFKEFFTYMARFVFILATNRLPRVIGGDLATWNRILKVPMTQSFPVGHPKRIEKLEPLLMAEREGIVQWLIEGYRKYKRDGLLIPKSVIDASAEYRENSDVVEWFLAENTDKAEAIHYERFDEVYQRYCGWARSKGDKEQTREGLMDGLRSRGFKVERAQSLQGRPQVIWGIKLLTNIPNVSTVLTYPTYPSSVRL